MPNIPSELDNDTKILSNKHENNNIDRINVGVLEPVKNQVNNVMKYLLNENQLQNIKDLINRERPMDEILEKIREEFSCIFSSSEITKDIFCEILIYNGLINNDFLKKCDPYMKFNTYFGGVKIFENFILNKIEKNEDLSEILDLFDELDLSLVNKKKLIIAFIKNGFGYETFYDVYELLKNDKYFSFKEAIDDFQDIILSYVKYNYISSFYQDCSESYSSYDANISDEFENIDYLLEYLSQKTGFKEALLEGLKEDTSKGNNTSYIVKENFGSGEDTIEEYYDQNTINDRINTLVTCYALFIGNANIDDSGKIKYTNIGYFDNLCKYFQNNPDNFSDEDLLYYYAHYYEVNGGIDGFHDYTNLKKIDIEILYKLISVGITKYICAHIDNFEGINHKEIALKLIENGEAENLAGYLHNFKGLDYKVFFSKLIDTRNGKELGQNLYNFKGLDQEVALMLIKDGNGKYIVNYLDSFKDLDHQEIALKLIEHGDSYTLVSNLEKFKDIDHQEIALKLIEHGDSYTLVSNLEKFKDIDHQEIALKLIEHGDSYTLVSNLEKFKDIDHQEIALKLIDSGNGKALAENLQKFEGLNQEIALKLIDSGNGKALAENLQKFEGLNQEIAFKLIASGLGRYVANDIELFNNIESLVVEIEKIKPFIVKGMNIEGDTVFSGDDVAPFIYPNRNFSPNNLNEYKDATEHLDNYTYNAEGYNFTLSNLLGYKLIEGKEKDSSIIEKFKKNIEHISSISKDNASLGKSVLEYAKNLGIIIESQELESQILEYLFKKEALGEKINVEDFDLLIAYQLMGKYDEFMKSSNDKLASYADEDTQYMIQIQALLKEYGDPLKESIRTLEKSTLEGKDRAYFDSFLRETPKEVSDFIKQKTINSIIRSFANRPSETITNEIVQKSIDTKLKAILQETDITETQRIDLGKEFYGKDFQFSNNEELQKIFIKKWKEQVENHFGSVDKLGLNIKSIAQTQDDIYNILQTESNKFESITSKKGQNKERHVFARFGKTKSDAYARGVGDICIGTDPKMWKNSNYFELILFDSDRQKNIGTTMLLHMEENPSEKYLLFGPNPSVEFDDKVSSAKLFEQISRIIIQFAKENNYDGVLFDPTHGKSTNRSGDFQQALNNSQLKNDSGEISKIDLSANHILGGGYQYKNNLSYLWRK